MEGWLTVARGIAKMRCETVLSLTIGAEPRAKNQQKNEQKTNPSPSFTQSSQTESVSGLDHQRPRPARAYRRA